jgi:hypothetical protein
MTTATDTAKSWTCDRCGVSVGRIDGERTALPSTWSSSPDGLFCLLCRRERAADAALDAAPTDSTRDTRARMRRAALIEFEVRRTPGHPDSSIAKVCRSSVSAVTEARRRLRLPKAGDRR